MTSTKVTSFTIDDIDSLYWFDPYNNNKFDSDDFEYAYLFGIAVTSYNYYYDAKNKGTLPDVADACIELHNAFVRMCKHIKLTPADIDKLERSIF